MICNWLLVWVRMKLQVFWPDLETEPHERIVYNSSIFMSCSLAVHVSGS